MVDAIDDESISVNIDAQSDKTNSDGSGRLGGSFMGNTLNEDGTVDAQQEINPFELANLSTANNKPGGDVLHEVTEAYQGAKISQKAGISSPNASVKGSVYNQAHSSATPQTGKVYPIFTLSSGIQVPGSVVLPTDKIIGVRYESNGVTIQRN